MIGNVIKQLMEQRLKLCFSEDRQKQLRQTLQTALLGVSDMPRRRATSAEEEPMCTPPVLVRLVVV